MLEKSLDLIVENNQAILKFDGEIIFENSNVLKEESKNRLAQKTEVDSLILDLSRVDYLDSSGVGVLLSLFKFMREREGSLAVAEPNEKIKRVFEVTKMGEIIPVYETLEAAVEKL